MNKKWVKDHIPQNCDTVIYDYVQDDLEDEASIPIYAFKTNKVVLNSLICIFANHSRLFLKLIQKQWMAVGIWYKTVLN